MTTIVAAPVRRSLAVRAPQARAFEVFTARIGDWWPRSHSIGASAMRGVVIEPRTGGRWYEVGIDGRESEWGHVLVWEPPARFVLAWQIGADLTFDPALITEVEVVFHVEGNDVTRVELEHRRLERIGERAQAMRDMVGGARGWNTVMANFAESCDITKS